MREAARELLASRADVWAFLSEPYRLSDWWPGILGLEPDRRGFAPGARWKVRYRISSRWGRKQGETTLVVRDVEPYERWSWHLVADELDVEIRLAAAGPDRTRVAITTNHGRPEHALKRLYDLCQTAARPDV